MILMKKYFMMICCMAVITLMITSCADARKQRMLNTPVEGILENGVRYEFVVEEFDLNEFLENNPLYVKNQLPLGRTFRTPSEVAERIGLWWSFPTFNQFEPREADQYYISIRFCIATDTWVLFIKPVDADNVEYSGYCSILRMITAKYVFELGGMDMFHFRINCPHASLYNEESRQRILSTSVEGVLENGVKYEFVSEKFNLEEFFVRNTGYPEYRGGYLSASPVIVHTPAEAAKIGLYHFMRSISPWMIDDFEPYFAYIGIHIRFCLATNRWVVVVILDSTGTEQRAFEIVQIITIDYSTGHLFHFHYRTSSPQEIIW